jgi:hypothetical protein
MLARMRDMIWSGLWLAGSLAVIGCRSNNEAQQSRPAEPPAKVADASEDPCKETPTGDVCRENLPVANPVTLANGRVRAVFEEETDQKVSGARCRVVDFTRSGEEAVATGCCERGHVVATALDERDRYYVLCKDGLSLEDTRLVARRLDPDRTFHNSSPVTALVPTDFKDVSPKSIPRHHLLVADGSTWLVHDLSQNTGAKDLYDLSYVQAIRKGAKPLAMDARFASAYVSDGTLSAITAAGDADDVKYRFYQLAGDRVVPLDEPAGVADARCEAWHGTAVDGADRLELRLVQYDQATESYRPVTIKVPHGRALPSPISRGSEWALCNGQWSRFTAPLAIGSRELTARAVVGSHAMSCTTSGCVLVYVSESEPGGHVRFHVHRLPAGGT